MFHVSEAGHATLCGVVGCFRGEKPQLREVGPPEQSQCDLRRPLAQPRPSVAPQNKSRPSQTHFSIPLCLPNYTSTNHVTSSLGSSIATSPSLLPAWGFGAAPAHPRDPKSDSRQKNLALTAALRRGSVPSLTSLIASGCFLAFVRYSNFGTHYAIPAKSSFSRISVQLRFIPMLFIYETFTFFVKMGPRRHYHTPDNKTAHLHLSRHMRRSGHRELKENNQQGGDEYLARCIFT